MNHFFLGRLLGGFLTLPAMCGPAELPDGPGFGLVWPAEGPAEGPSEGLAEGPAAGGEAMVRTGMFAVCLPEYLSLMLSRNTSCSSGRNSNAMYCLIRVVIHRTL